MAIALDEEAVGHLDRPDPGDAADVVAAEVEQHQMLGALFRIGKKLGAQRLVLGWALAARPCAGDRADDDLALAHPDQDLRARADDLEAAEVEEAEIRRGIDPPQRPVERKCGQVEPAGEPLRQHDLEGVARGDVVLRPDDHRLKFGLAGVRPRFARLDQRIDGHSRRVIEGQFERVHARVQPRHRALVSRARRDARRRAHRGHDRHLVARAVEHDHHGRADEQRLGHADRIRLCRGEALHPPHHVIAEIAEHASRHRRQAGRHEMRNSASSDLKTSSGSPGQGTKASGSARARRLISA